MKVDRAKNPSHVVHGSRTIHAWGASAVLIAALMPWLFGAMLGVIVAAQGDNTQREIEAGVDSLLGPVGVEVGAGSFVTLGSGSGVDPLLGVVGVEVSPGSSVALGSASSTRPLLGDIGVEDGPGSSVALSNEVSSSCSGPDRVPAAYPELAYIFVYQSC